MRPGIEWASCKTSWWNLENDAEKKPTGLSRHHRGRPQAGAVAAREAQTDQENGGIRCVIDTANDPFEILDECHAHRHAPRRPVRAFRELAEHRGWGAEEIAARFGVTAHNGEAAASARRGQPEADAKSIVTAA